MSSAVAPVQPTPSPTKNVENRERRKELQQACHQRWYDRAFFGSVFAAVSLCCIGHAVAHTLFANASYAKSSEEPAQDRALQLAMGSQSIVEGLIVQAELTMLQARLDFPSIPVPSADTRAAECYSWMTAAAMQDVSHLGLLWSESGIYAAATYRQFSPCTKFAIQRRDALGGPLQEFSVNETGSGLHCTVDGAASRSWPSPQFAAVSGTASWGSCLVATSTTASTNCSASGGTQSVSWIEARLNAVLPSGAAYIGVRTDGLDISLQSLATASDVVFVMDSHGQVLASSDPQQLQESLAAQKPVQAVQSSNMRIAAAASLRQQSGLHELELQDNTKVYAHTAAVNGKYNAQWTSVAVVDRPFNWTLLIVSVVVAGLLPTLFCLFMYRLLGGISNEFQALTGMMVSATSLQPSTPSVGFMAVTESRTLRLALGLLWTTICAMKNLVSPALAEHIVATRGEEGGEQAFRLAAQEPGTVLVVYIDTLQLGSVQQDLISKCMMAMEKIVEEADGFIAWHSNGMMMACFAQQGWRGSWYGEYSPAMTACYAAQSILKWFKDAKSLVKKRSSDLFLVKCALCTGDLTTGVVSSSHMGNVMCCLGPAAQQAVKLCQFAQSADCGPVMCSDTFRAVGSVFLARLLAIGNGGSTAPHESDLRAYELREELSTASTQDLQAAQLYGEALEAIRQEDYLAALGQLKEVVQTWPSDPVANCTLSIVADRLTTTQQKVLMANYSSMGGKRMLASIRSPKKNRKAKALETVHPESLTARVHPGSSIKTEQLPPATENT